MALDADDLYALTEEHMPILPPQLPSDGTDAISRALASLSRQSGTVASRVVSASDIDGSIHFEFAAPHPVFIAGLKQVADGHPLKEVRPDGWRYLLLRGDEAVGSATVQWDESQKGFVFSHVTQGPFVASTLEGLGRVEQLPAVRKSSFELRVLDVPALGVRALWLHGPRDLLLPLRPAPPPLEAYKPYSEKKLAALLHESAVKQIARASERAD